MQKNKKNKKNYEVETCNILIIFPGQFRKINVPLIIF